MDYFNNVFTTFLGFESGINVAVYQKALLTLMLWTKKYFKNKHNEVLKVD